MQKEQRHTSILQKLQLSHKISTHTLAIELAVSEDTIRRDLNELAQKGLLTKVHGGAISSIQKLYYYNENVIKNREAKDAIAQKALPLLQHGMSIIISDGTTNLAFARNIPKNLKISVFTYCLPIAMELTEHPNIEIIFFGGKIEKKGMVATGHNVALGFKNIRADICFLGTGSLTSTDGITGASFEVSLIKKNIIAASKQVVSLATSNKIGLSQTHLICPSNKIDVLITELAPTHFVLAPFSNLGIRVL